MLLRNKSLPRSTAFLGLCCLSRKLLLRASPFAQTLFLPLAPLSLLPVAARGFFVASLFYCAVGCRKARFYSLRSAENRREIEPRFSFCRAARSFHAHFLSVSLSEARQGRYSFPPRRSALYPSLFFTR